MAHNWYAIQTYSGSEQSVKQSILLLVKEMGIENKLLDIVVPTEDVIEVRNGKKRIIEKPIYQSYVFIKIELDRVLWQKIQSLPKVSKFIGESKAPTPLSDKDIQKILDRVNNRAAPKPRISFDSAEMIRIIDGPFANFQGMVEEYDMEKGTVKLNVSIFGRNTPVELLYTQVEKII